VAAFILQALYVCFTVLRSLYIRWSSRWPAGKLGFDRCARKGNNENVFMTEL
jgi:hypothetical protein